MSGVLLDIDVILKLCAYRLCDHALAVASVGDLPPAILSIGRFTVRSRLTKATNLADAAAARQAFADLLIRLRTIDPTDEEIALAADFEESAAALGLEFDIGESQLLAVLLTRDERMLLTGDKRAVRAAAKITGDETNGRIACLEQLIAEILGVWDPETTRALICAEPRADRALTACFGCSSAHVSVDDVLAGLRSYTADLRKSSGAVLVSGDRLSIVA